MWQGRISSGGGGGGGRAGGMTNYELRNSMDQKRAPKWVVGEGCFRRGGGGGGLRAGGGLAGTPSSQGPPMVPAEGGPHILKSCWHRRRRSNNLSVSLKNWKGRRGGGSRGGYPTSSYGVRPF